MALRFQVFSMGGVVEEDLFAGMTLGRKHASLTIDDKKASGRHAVVEKKGDVWILRDTGSRNGLVVEGKRVGETPLFHGLELLIGDTLLRVIDTSIMAPQEPHQHERAFDLSFDQQTRETKVLQIPSDWGDDEAEDDEEDREEVSLKTPPPRPTDWRSRLSDVLDSAQHRDAVAPSELYFDPPVRLVFIRGPLLDTEITFNAGPRTIGPFGEISLVENPQVPIYFFLEPVKGGARLVSKLKEFVFVNGSLKDSSFLADGDQIQMGSTVIRIEYDRDA